MRYRRKNSPLRWLVWAIPAAVTALIIINWPEFYGLVTGHGNNPPPAAGTAPPDRVTGAQTPVATEELGPDGFPIRARQHVLKYTVQPGDALLLIAEKFKLSPNTIFWANTETLRDNVDLILTGTKLYILPVDGVYHLSDGSQTIAQIADLYGVTPDAILNAEYNNNLTGFSPTDKPPAGLRIVVPGGRRDFLSWQSPIHTGAASGQANPQGASHPGSCRERYTGAGGTGQYDNPIGQVSYRVTTGFEPWHPGVDLAVDQNVPIYAADTGVIVFSGWHRVGYGELIIIDHGNGWTTYYGHLSARFVGCGDQVKKGQRIGLMGATGNATGIHLHFEIRQNDVPQNPYDFIQIHDSRGSQP